jgi:hypothetical protein
MAAAAAGGGSSSGSIATVVAQGRHKVRLTMLKPPADMEVSVLLVVRASCSTHQLLFRLQHTGCQVLFITCKRPAMRIVFWCFVVCTAWGCGLCLNLIPAALLPPLLLLLLPLLLSLCHQDPLAIVDLAKAADVLLLLLSGSSSAAAIDELGSSNIAILRALGLPTCVAVVSSSSSSSSSHQQSNGTADVDLMEDSEDPMAADGAAAGAAGSGKQTPAVLKERSAAKKRAEKALQHHLPGDIKLVSGDHVQDMQQLLRTLADSTPQLPVWRRQRPYLMVQQAAFVPQQQQQQQQQGGDLGELHLTGYVRAQGLSANQLVTVPGAGDFQILRIEAAREPTQQQQQQQRHRKGAAVDTEMQEAAGGGRVLAQPDVEQQEQLVRENEFDPLAGMGNAGLGVQLEGTHTGLQLAH